MNRVDLYLRIVTSVYFALGQPFSSQLPFLTNYEENIALKRLIFTNFFYSIWLIFRKAL